MPEEAPSNQPPPPRIRKFFAFCPQPRSTQRARVLKALPFGLKKDETPLPHPSLRPGLTRVVRTAPKPPTPTPES